MTMRLPIDDALPELIDALRKRGRAVLQAPPGAGKTTRVPLAIRAAGLTQGRIVMLEPRRLAARAAAERMAETLGEPVGQTVGYRVRGESAVSKSTQVEVVTEGILTRMIQSDPELSGIGAIIFDEFHERSLNADLGLALALEIAGALRDDLLLIVMSATLDAAPVAELMEAPILTSAGRAYDVDIRHLDRPTPAKTRFDDAMVDLILCAHAQAEGAILAFLPGEGEIRSVEAKLKPRLSDGTVIRPLYGAMDFAAQRAAIRPDSSARKIVLATSIAETSLTIEDIRIVVDGGLARRARFDPASGMSRLITEKASRAEATQRAGRAGRVAAGVCYRLWTRGEEGALPAFAPAEIEVADLSGLALELALWQADATALPFLTQPPEGALAEARGLLTMLGALDGNRITDHGRKIAALPLHPRLAHMLTVAGKPAAPLAALMADRDPMGRDTPVDLRLRIDLIRKGQADHPFNRLAVDRIRAEAKRLASAAPDQTASDVAEMAALAYPDRIGQRRKGGDARYVLSGGKGAILDNGDPLASSPFLVITDIDGNPREAKVRQATAITEGQIRALFADQITRVQICEWSRRDRRVVARDQERFGAIVLSDRIWRDAPPDAVASAMLDGVRDMGLTLSDAARRFVARVQLLDDMPDMTEAGLLDTAEEWLLPHLSGVTNADGWRNFDLLEPLRGRLDWGQMQRLDREVPAHFTTPLDRKIPIDYSGEHPEISLRLQEMFGQKVHPMVAGRPLRVTLLSPAGRPVQTTMDLPNFWRTSYSDVRKDMRGQYPKHPWPEDPTIADPTLRAKPRA